MFKAEIYLCEKKDFDFEKFYLLIHAFKTKMNIILEELRGEGSKIYYRFINDSEYIYINFDSRYERLNLDLIVDGNIESFNEYYKEIEKTIKYMFYFEK